MRFVILSINPEFYSVKRLVNSCQNLSYHDIQIINPFDCILSHQPQAFIYLDKKPIPAIDILIPRIGTQLLSYSFASLRHFEMISKIALNTSQAIENTMNQYTTLQILAKAELPIPKTLLVHPYQDKKDLLDILPPPIVFKLLSSSQGRGIMLAENKRSALSMMDGLATLQQTYLMQQYIYEAEHKDIRCFVLNNQVIAAIERQAHPDDFRSNLHKGGQANTVKLTDLETQIAVQACQAVGLNMGGVDIIRSSQGPLLLEVNATPDLTGVEQITGKDIAKEIIQYLIHRFVHL